MTKNKYWLFLEKLRKSGVTNMHAAAPYLQVEFGLNSTDARDVLMDWMQNYNPQDYEEE